MSDICKINVSILKSYEKDFKSELNNFNNKTYTTFSSSYLKNCSDAYVRRMSNELQTLYDKVKKGYQNIDKWWVDYNANVEGLENYLSDNGSAGAISESSIRNSVNQLPNLKKYNLKFAGIIPASMVGTSYNTAFTNNAVVSAVDPFSSLYSDYRVSEVNASKVVNNDNVVDQIDEAISTASASVVSWAKNIGSNIKNFFVSTGAKISSFGETVVSKASEVIEDVDNFFDETKAYVANKAESLWDKTTEWWNDTTQKVDNWFGEVGTNISNGAKSLWADVTDWWSDVEDWWNDDAIPWIQNAANAVWDVVKSVGATVAVFVQSLVEGILQFGEAIIDFVALVGTGVASIVTGLIDGGQAIYGAITGNEWSSVTKQMWGGTMGFVSNQYVSGWFDLLYQNTGYGQWLAENAYGFDITRSIGSGIGYIAGVVVLTIATFGAGSVVAAGGSVTASTAAAATTATQMAFTATAAGIGRGTQNAWADGADLLEGLAAGTLTGLWEGLQFYVGGKISGLNIFGADGILKSIGSSGIGTKLLNGLARVVLDGADGGVEGFVLPLITSIYKDGYYDENGNYVEFSDDQNIFERYSEVFDDNGGWTTVWTQASIGSATSLLGELFDLRKYFKDSKNKPNINISEQELQVKIDRYNELLDIKNSEDYLSYMDNAKKGYAQELKLEFEGIEKEFATLESELSLIAGIASETDVDISAIMDDVETEKLFDYDGNQPTVDLFATEKIVPEVEATLDMFATEKIANMDAAELNTVQKLARRFDTYEEFVAAYKNSTESWRSTLTDDELKLIYAYIGESDKSSYATINSVMRDIAINKENKTITLYHMWGPKTYTFDEYFNQFGETVDQFIVRTYDEAIALNNAIGRTTFTEDTIVARGVDMNALGRFGITAADSPDDIMRKLGSIYTDKGFMSSTPVAGGGFTYKDVNFVMTCKKGMAFGDFSLFNAGEKEILLGLGSKFTIESVEKVGNKIMIYMTSIN